MTALKDPPSHAPEVLIDEARRRQDQRRRALTGLVALIVVVAAIFGIFPGGGGPSGSTPTAHGGGSGGSMVASWHELSAAEGALPAGSEVSSLIPYRGELLAAGSIDWPARLRKASCSQDCGTVVWASRLGSRWHVVFATQQGNADSQLVPERAGVALVPAGRQGLLAGVRLSRADVRKILASRAPMWMPGPASVNQGQVIYSIGEDDTGPPAATRPAVNAELDWISPEGTRWSLNFSRELTWRSVLKVGDGYVGLSDVGKRALWSANGRSWSATSMRIPAADLAELAAGPRGAVLELVPSRFPYRAKPVELWYSPNGRVWSRSAVIGNRPAISALGGGVMPTLISVDGGYLALNRANSGIWWSQTGRSWRPVSESGTPSARLLPQALTIDSDSLIVVEEQEGTTRRTGLGVTKSPGPVTFWRVALRKS